MSRSRGPTVPVPRLAKDTRPRIHVTKAPGGHWQWRRGRDGTWKPEDWVVDCFSNAIQENRGRQLVFYFDPDVPNERMS